MTMQFEKGEAVKLTKLIGCEIINLILIVSSCYWKRHMVK